MVQYKEENIEIIDEAKEDSKKLSNKKRKRFKKKLFFQVAFCTISILFITCCFIFYGIRLVRYYKIYNPKGEDGKNIKLLSSSIVENTPIVYEKDGLYKETNGYIYKGVEVNNYIEFSGLKWRILKVSSDGTIDLILDDYINILKWNESITEYSSSDINEYLNEKILTILNKDLITKTPVCKDIVDDINKISCKEIDTESYIRLLNINEFLNSKAENSFINDESNIWLANRGKEKVWNINSSSISYSPPEETYEIKPVITLKSSNTLNKGTGTKEDPYIVKENKNDWTVGKYVKINEDIWTTYEVNDKSIRLSLDSSSSILYPFSFNTNKFSVEEEDSLANYLNTEFYESLLYKDKLEDTIWYTGEYDKSYKDIYSEKINAKVGLLSIADLKFDNENDGYYLLNGIENKIYLYKKSLILSKPTLSRIIRPAISIKKPIIKSGAGTKIDPYVLEV